MSGDPNSLISTQPHQHPHLMKSVAEEPSTLKDVFVAFANNNTSFMSSIEFFKFCKHFKIYPVSGVEI